MSKTTRFKAAGFGELSVIEHDTKCVLRFTASNGNIQEIEMATDLFQEIADHFHGAAHVIRQKLGDAGEFITTPLSVDVGLFVDHAPPSVGLRFDHGDARERTYELSPRQASDLAKELVAGSRKCKSLGGRAH